MKMFPIRWAKFLSVFFALSLFAGKKNQPSYIIEVKKKSKLFERPSSKATVIGEADEGTNLIFLEESIKGFWIKAQDSGGLVGWLPKDRTDFGDIVQSVESEAVSKNIEKREKNKNILEKSKDLENFSGVKNYRLSPFYRTFLNAKRTTLLGLRFDLKTGFLDLNGERNRSYFLSVEGALPTQFQKVSDGFSGALRFSMKAPLNEIFFYGSDYGYSFENNDFSFYHHFSVGIFGGLDLGRIDARLRAGYDFFSGSHATVEVQLGCLF